MKRIMMSAILLLFLNSCNKMVTIVVRDSQTGRPLQGVRVVLEQNGIRNILGYTDSTGTAKVAVGQGILYCFRNYYRPFRKNTSDIRTLRLMISMTESRPPSPVSRIRIEGKSGNVFLKWNASSSSDTARYVVSYASGLAKNYRLLKEIAAPSTSLRIGAPAANTDHHYRVVAIDANGNRNYGAEKHFFFPDPYILPRANARIEGTVTGSSDGKSHVIFHPVNLGTYSGYPVKRIIVRCDRSGRFRSPLLPAGRYTVEAFIDENGNGFRDGYWGSSSGEPVILRQAVRVRPGQTITLTLRPVRPASGLPQPVFAEEPGLVTLYNAAWGFARKKIFRGRPEKGFSHMYMDEGFNNHIYQWDTCFMMFFGMYGGAEFPAMNSIDNFYRSQHPNGYICRVRNEETGGDYAPKLKDPHVNPPLFAWVEHTYYMRTGDDSRLLRALYHNHRYFLWLKNNIRTSGGFYFTSNLGSGMDNSPREGMVKGWVDITAQMALFSRMMFRLADAAGLSGFAGRYRKEYEELRKLINSRMWDNKTGFYRDINFQGKFHNRKTIAGFWPMLAGVAGRQETDRLVRHLRDPKEFFTPHLFPTLSRDEPEYDAKGYYWRGAVWAPTTFMVIKGLETQGRTRFARDASRNHLDNMLAVYRDFRPEKNRLPYNEHNIPFPRHLDGTRQIWECYSPERNEPSTRWDNRFYVRPEFVGWSGAGPITLFLENVIGIRTDVPGRTIRWEIGSVKRHGIKNMPFGRHRLYLMMERMVSGSPVFTVKSPVPFTMIVSYRGKEKRFSVRPGRTVYR